MGQALLTEWTLQKCINNTDNDLVLKYEELRIPFGYQEQKLLIWIQDTLKDFLAEIRKDRKFNKK